MVKKRVFGTVTQIPLSPALHVGEQIFVSGQVPTGADGQIVNGIEAQTRIVLDKIKALLEEAGSSLDKVVKTTVFLKDKSDFAVMNAVYSEYFSEPWPTRSTIQCELMIDIRVEIEAIAQA